MTIEQTSLQGLLLIHLDVIPDSRGSFREAWHSQKLHELGLPSFKPVQHNVVHSNKGVLRGVHAEPWDKYVHPCYGQIFACIVDLRPQSQTFGQHATFDLDDTKALLVPNGFGNSYQTTSDFSLYSYLVSEHWRPGIAYASVIYNDPDLGINWPIKDAIVSDKDLHNPTLRQAFPDQFNHESTL